MSKRMIYSLAIAVMALASPLNADFDTVGIYDPDDAPHHNQVDQSGLYDSHTEDAGPGNVIELQTFQELIGPAFEADAGGVVDGEGHNGSLDGQDMIANFGISKAKSVTFTSTSGLINSGSSVKNNRRPISGSARWAKSNTADFVFDISRVTGGAPTERVTYFAATLMHRDNRNIDPVVTATFSGGGTVTAVADMTMEGPINSKDTFFGFVAPPGQSIVNVNFDLGGYTNLDDLAFITSEFVVVSERASDPTPTPGAGDVPRDTLLTWTPGAYAETHDVYFGTSFDDVNSATRANPSDALVSQNQDSVTYDPPGTLEFAQTYHWRVDEVNAAPDNTIFKGHVWSFTTEPLVYPIENIAATASSAAAGTGPDNTINSSGLQDDRHNTDSNAMWFTEVNPPQPVWIQYEFNRTYSLDEMWVWNHNLVFEHALGYGLKDVTVEYSTNGTDWTTLADVQFAQGPSQPDYAHDTIIDFGGISARYIRLTPHNNWGSLPQYGLSEVRFLYTPVHAREPQPADGQTDVHPDTMLTWRPGRKAAAHEVYIGQDPDALPLLETVSEPALVPGDLEFGRTYHWRIDEVNDSEEPTTWQGETWTFATQQYAVIENFESYDDEANPIFETWIDGWANETGATVGYLDAPFAEQTVVNAGGQSMPLAYDNTDAPFYSETSRLFNTAQDWTIHGADTLVLHLRGNPAAFLERNDGAVAVSGAGADIWNDADEFRYVSRQLAGDGEIIARVDSLIDTHVWAKVGVMIRESVAPDSPFAAVYITPGNGCSFQARTGRNVSATSDSALATPDQTAVTAPAWVKLQRTGDQFTGSYSSDGLTWTTMAWTPPPIPMIGDVRIGLAVTSHSAGNPTVAEFSGLATAGDVTGQWQADAIGAEQPSNDPAPLYVTVEDTPGNLATVTHPDSNATGMPTWQQWRIPFSRLDGVSMDRVQALHIGVGEPDSPTLGGKGLIFIDDIWFGHPANDQ